MSTPEVSADLRGPAAPDALAALQEVRGLELEREGIAMVLAVADLRPGRRLVVEDDTARADGTRLAELFDTYWAGLEAAGFPPADEWPDETGAPHVIDTLVVLSDRHLSRRRLLAPTDGRSEATGD